MAKPNPNAANIPVGRTREGVCRKCGLLFEQTLTDQLDDYELELWVPTVHPDCPNPTGG